MPSISGDVAGYIHNLVSALGGNDAASTDNAYVLGDDALGCLRDIKRWLQHYDEKRDRWDVKAALGAMNVVTTDLCPILSAWQPRHDTIGEDDPVQRRIALACVEILVPITWPLDLGQDPDDTKIRQYPNLKLALRQYKTSLLFDTTFSNVLPNVMRVAYPSLAVPRHKRSDRDIGIIRLVLYLLRNLSAIDESSRRSETIIAFDKARALDFLSTLASGIGEDFTDEDVIVLDVFYNLLRGVDSSTVFDLTKSDTATIANELGGLLSREKDMRTSHRSKAHTRHNRFGTMVSIVKDDRRYTIPSQAGVLQNPHGGRLESIDAAKKWNRPARGIKAEEDIDRRVSLNIEARCAVGSFTRDLLESGFNPLFSSLLRALESDSTRISQDNRRQFLWLQGWCLKAMRQKARSDRKKSNSIDCADADFDADADWRLVGAVLEQRALITLRKMLREAIETREWKEAHAAMECLREVLQTLGAMQMSSDVDFQEIAENLLSNLFYEEQSLELIATAVRTYTNQSFGYLDAVTELAAVLLKMLEKHASAKTHMYVRARRQRQRKKRQVAQTSMAPGVDSRLLANQDSGNASEDEEAAEAQAREAVHERAFDYLKFEAKFMNEHAVDTYVALLEFYADLSSEQIKRCIAFFHRCAIKQQREVLIFRIDLLELMLRMVNDTAGLPSNSSARSEVHNFLRYIFRRLCKSVDAAPALVWEILFPKMSADGYYLTHHEDRAPKIKASPRVPAELKVLASVGDREQQLKVVVGALLDAGRNAWLEWLATRLDGIVSEKMAWEARSAAIDSMQVATSALDDRGVTAAVEQPSFSLKCGDDTDLEKMVFADGRARLLLKLLGAVRTGDRTDASAFYVLTSEFDADTLKRDAGLLREWLIDTPTFDDGKTAQDYLRREGKRNTSTDDGESDESSDDMSDRSSAIHERATKRGIGKGKQRKRQRRRSSADQLVDDEELEERRRRRAEAEAERHRQIKSSKYVHDSDLEDDEAADAEFFAREAALRERMKLKAQGLLMAEEMGGAGKTKAKKSRSSQKLQSQVSRSPVDTDEDSDLEITRPVAMKQPTRSSALFFADSDDEEVTYTNARAVLQSSPQKVNTAGMHEGVQPLKDASRPMRRRGLIFSDDEDD
ncbi:Topoisomerase 1-associated factor 1 [Savitreella phatthalungensis]